MLIIAYVPGLAIAILLLGAAVLIAKQSECPPRVRVLAALAMSCTWGATAYSVVDPLPEQWLHALSLSAWVLMSLLSLILFAVSGEKDDGQPPTTTPSTTATPRYSSRSTTIRAKYRGEK